MKGKKYNEGGTDFYVRQPDDERKGAWVEARPTDGITGVHRATL
jgi:hypothetical protein